MGVWRDSGNRAGMHVLAAAWLGIGDLVAGLCYRWVASRDVPSAPAGIGQAARSTARGHRDRPHLLRQAAGAVAAAIRAGPAPGPVLLVGLRGHAIRHEAFGTTAPTARRDWGALVTQETLLAARSLFGGISGEQERG